MARYWELKVNGIKCGDIQCLPPNLCWQSHKFNGQEMCWPRGFDPDNVDPPIVLPEGPFAFLMAAMFFGGIALCVLLLLAICCVKSCAKKCRAREDPPIDGGGENVWRNRFGSMRQSYRRALERARHSSYISALHGLGRGRSYNVDQAEK